MQGPDHGGLLGATGCVNGLLAGFAKSDTGYPGSLVVLTRHCRFEGLFVLTS